MRRAALLLALLTAFPVSAQGWAKASAGWTKISSGPGGSYATMPAPTGCVSTSVPVFLGSPVALGCDAGLTYDAGTDTLTVGKVSAGSFKNTWGNAAFIDGTDAFRIGNSSVYGINGQNGTNGTVSDTGASYGGSPGLWAFGNGTGGDFSGGTKAATHRTAGPNGAEAVKTTKVQLVTLDTGGTTTATAAGFVPAGSRIIAITYRITTTITTAVNFTVGVTGGTAFVSAGTATAAQTTITAGDTGILVPANFGDQYVTAASTVTITTNANPGAGAMRLALVCETYTPPAT